MDDETLDILLLGIGKKAVTDLRDPVYHLLLVIEEAITMGVDISNIFEHKDLNDLKRDIENVDKLIARRTRQ